MPGAVRAVDENGSMKACSIDGCEGKHKAWGLCQKHYCRERNRGTTWKRPTLRERLMAKVQKTPNGCWMWTGARNGTVKYGGMTVEGRSVYAHRVSYELHRGPIPEGMDLDHLCHTPLCVNPDHLEPVPHSENSRRGRATRLTREQVVEIRRRLSNGEIGRRVAEQYGVAETTISAIRHEHLWRGV